MSYVFRSSESCFEALGCWTPTWLFNKTVLGLPFDFCYELCSTSDEATIEAASIVCKVWREHFLGARPKKVSFEDTQMHLFSVLRIFNTDSHDSSLTRARALIREATIIVPSDDWLHVAFG
ncbi:uncharacterized protein FTOL_06424 [Fusarium torulosum]|uniref:Uncharacterized protein n=1 Tax=Fusarium torulosum TaxID=33205 RepID=A0AAE8M9U7_9HYPO|nr:uncharacterized protein FTOL_06424 [Fusarium torulosum]